MPTLVYWTLVLHTRQSFIAYTFFSCLFTYNNTHLPPLRLGYDITVTKRYPTLLLLATYCLKMRLFVLETFTLLLAVRQLVGVLASPIRQLQATEHLQGSETLEQRASSYAVELKQVEDASNTFTGVNPLRGLFNLPFTDQQMQEAAKATFELWDRKQRYPGQSSLLVAVIGVPGYGLAAGTIWHSVDASFAQRAESDTPKLWRLIQRQAIRPGTDKSLWHAEIVASWVAESNFADRKEGSRWPEGTKIAIYGRETVATLDRRQEKITGYKSVCQAGATSNTIPCSTLMQAQRISVVNPPP